MQACNLPTVLFVDDDANLLASFRRSFQGIYAVETSLDGQDGARRIQDGLDPDVVVTDLRMPGMDGLELLAGLHSSAPELPGILLTGHADLDVAMAAINQGQVFRFLTKPCTSSALTQAIDQALTKNLVDATNGALALGQTPEDTVRGLVKGLHAFMAYRDPYTAEHQSQTALLSVALGMRMGLDPHLLENLRLAALVHDVGKLYVPAEILNRPGRLQPHELAFIHEHVRVGYEIFKPIAAIWPGAAIIHQHHERLDGSGYPQGLSGREICQGARILSVADTLDAMRSHRPYRPGLGLQAALRELRGGRGVRYDPDVVDACLLLESAQLESLQLGPVQPGSGDDPGTP